MKKPVLFCLMLLSSLFLLPGCDGGQPREQVYDIVVYGGTAGGVMAAVQATRLGRTVALIEPGAHLGGLTSGGLGATDIGNKAAIGGLSREFYRAMGEHYAHPEAWVHEQAGDYASGRGTDPLDELMWTFEPHVAEQALDRFIEQAGVPVFRGERLDRQGGVTLESGRIVAIRMESGRAFRGRMFIDAGYEGDLLAAAGVSYTVGREGNDTYGETLNGVQTANALYHQFALPVSAYLTPGDPASGLLPGIDPEGPGREGAGDRRVQAYNFRMCLTDVADNRAPFERPADYDSLRYEPLLRYYEAGFDRIPWNPVMMPNRKTDTNNNLGFSTDFIGRSYDYPEADYATRERIFREHLSYQQGLMWTLANHPRVPEAIRQEVSRWGLARDEFADNGHWPHQLYIREARRMVGATVMTQHHCQGQEVAADPVGLAAYTMDSHHVQRYADSTGAIRNEGDVEVGGFPPYPISFRAIVPRQEECANLLVPVCLSASHIAYGSIRMEPVFMVLGQSAATAASQALEEDCAIQAIDYPRLKARLLEDGQVLAWEGPAGAE